MAKTCFRSIYMSVLNCVQLQEASYHVNSRMVPSYIGTRICPIMHSSTTAGLGNVQYNIFWYLPASFHRCAVQGLLLLLEYLMPDGWLQVNLRYVTELQS